MFSLRHYLQKSLFFLLIVTVYSCALSPQMVTIHPLLDLPSKDIGQDRTIALEVVDRRPDMAFGPRGGIYTATSLITPARDLATSIRDVLVTALHNYRFVVAQPGAPSSLRMAVSIDEVRYIPAGDPVVNHIKTNATLSVTCDSGGRQYKSQYKVSSSRDVFTAPSAEENERLINAILSKALQRMMSDQGLLDFLQRN